MAFKSWKKYLRRKLRKARRDYRFKDAKKDDIIDWGNGKSYKFNGKRWKKVEEQDELEIAVTDNADEISSEVLPSAKALSDFKATADANATEAKRVSDEAIAAAKTAADDAIKAVKDDLDNLSQDKIKHDDNSYSQMVDANLHVNTQSGYVQVGAMNTSHAHIYTDRPDFYFNKELMVNGNTVVHSGNVANYVPDGNKAIYVDTYNNGVWSVTTAFNHARSVVNLKAGDLLVVRRKYSQSHRGNGGTWYTYHASTFRCVMNSSTTYSYYW